MCVFATLHIFNRKPFPKERTWKRPRFNSSIWCLLVGNRILCICPTPHSKLETKKRREVSMSSSLKGLQHMTRLSSPKIPLQIQTFLRGTNYHLRPFQLQTHISSRLLHFCQPLKHFSVAGVWGVTFPLAEEQNKKCSLHAVAKYPAMWRDMLLCGKMYYIVRGEMCLCVARCACVWRDLLV